LPFGHKLLSSEQAVSRLAAIVRGVARSDTGRISRRGPAIQGEGQAMTDNSGDFEQPASTSDAFADPPQASHPQPPMPDAPPSPPPSPVAPPPPAPTPPPVSAPKRRPRIASFCAVAVAVGVIGLKVAAGFGLGWVFNESKHRASDAERVVQTAMQADTEAALIATFAPGTTEQNLVDATCAESIQSATQFSIPSSKKNSDGTADVQMKFGGVNTKFAFHLVNQDGWKIVRLTCR